MANRVLPVYLLIDVSFSMAGEPLHELNALLAELSEVFHDDPAISTHTRLSVATFSDSADTLLPLSNLPDARPLPKLTAHGGTSYAAAFQHLRHMLDHDIPRLKAEGNVAILRPVVFFITDGEPTEDSSVWIKSLHEVVDPSWSIRPIIIALGFGAANAQILKLVGKYAFIADGSMAQVDAVREVGAALIGSIKASRSSLATQSAVMVPKTIPGFSLLSSVVDV